MRIRLRSLVTFLVLSVLLAGPSSTVEAQKQDPLAKISPLVIEKSKGNQPTEFLVILADQADISGAEVLRTKDEKGTFVFKALLDKAQATQASMIKWLQTRGVEYRPFYVVNMVWVKSTLDIAQALASRPEVARIEGNPVVPNHLGFDLKPVIRSDYTIESIESGISYSRAPQVWALGYTGQGAVVGGGDTGYLWNHTALQPHYRGWNGVTADHNYNWHDSIHAGSSTGNPCGYDLAAPCDDNGHGTHTVGTATGDDGAGNQIGMAPGAKWIGCRNMDANNGTPARYAECFQFFLAPYPVGGTPAQGDPTKAPDVTTNSWACPASEGCTSATWGIIEQAIQANRSAGIVTVVAAGNSGSGCSTVSDAPSFFPESLTVGALNTGSDTIASFSSRGPVTIDGSNRMKPDIAAPGTSTRSAFASSTNAYASLSGTSMATPHVAGAVALILSAQPKLRGQVNVIEGILKDSAVHISSALCNSSGTPNNVFGSGRLDVKAATDMALTVAAPLSLAFGSMGTDGMLAVSAPPGVNWTASTSDSWITIVTGSGVGSGPVNFIVRDNPGPSFRVGTISIARREYTIRQEGSGASGCSYSVSPTNSVVSPAGGTGSFTVSTAASCIWAASSNVGWVTITSDNGGAGSGAVSFSVAANLSGVARKGTITVAGKTFTVKQK